MGAALRGAIRLVKGWREEARHGNSRRDANA
jgi:hypothetical protein